MNTPQYTGEDGEVKVHELERDIRRTRREMAETIDNLQTRLSPDHLIDDALTTFTDSVERSLDKFFSAARRRPLLTAALVTGMVAWLAMSGSKGRGRRGIAGRRAPRGPVTMGPFEPLPVDTGVSVHGKEYDVYRES